MGVLKTFKDLMTRNLIYPKVKEKTTKLLGQETAKQMFHDIDTIYTFHSEYLLPSLSDRLKKW